jgi:hypothetical protein
MVLRGIDHQFATRTNEICIQALPLLDVRLHKLTATLGILADQGSDDRSRTTNY